MAVQFPNFLNAQILKPDYSGIGDALQNVLAGYEGAQRPRQLKDEAETRRLDNILKAVQAEYAKPEAQAKLGLMGAQASQASAAAEKSRMIQDLMKGIFQGSSFAPVGVGGQPSTYADQGTNPTQGVQEEIDAVSNKAPMVQPQKPGLNYAQAALAQHLLGLGQPQILDIDGKKVAATPFGNIDVAQGMTPLQKELTKQDAKQIDELDKSVISSYGQKDTQEELASVMNDPIFEAMRQFDWTPGYELQYYAKGGGTPEQQDLAGKFMTLSGNLVKASARDFAGQFRVGEQALLMDMKPNASDSLGVAKGKLEALMLMRELLTKRAELASQIARRGSVPPSQALKKADQMMNAEEIRAGIKEKLKSSDKIPMLTPDGRRVLVPKSQEKEFIRRGGKRG